MISPLTLPAVDLDHLVLEDGRVGERPVEDRALGDLDEFRGDLDGAPASIARGPSSVRPLSLVVTRDRHQAKCQGEAAKNGPAACAACMLLRLPLAGAMN